MFQGISSKLEIPNCTWVFLKTTLILIILCDLKWILNVCLRLDGQEMTF